MTLQEKIQLLFSKINKLFLEYGGYVSLILYIILAIFIFSKNPYNLINKYKPFSILITLIIGFFIINTSNFDWQRSKFFGIESDKPSLIHWFKTCSAALGILLLTGLLIYSSFLLISNFGRFLSFLYQFSFYLSIIAGLGLLYKLLTPYFSKTKLPDTIELIKNIIFYLPCVLIKIIENIVGTKRSVWLILIIELIAITAYFGIPYLFKSKYLKKGTIIASEPQHLNSISSLDQDALDYITNISRDTMHYAISAEIWIDPQPTSTNISYTKDTNILSFGDRLRVEYNGTTPQKLIIKAMEGKKTEIVAKPDISLQKWNKLVINYDHGVLDIFLNNELIHSQQNIPYVSIANIESGSKKGIYGGIKNIRFFDKPLTKNEMYLI